MYAPRPSFPGGCPQSGMLELDHSCPKQDSSSSRRYLFTTTIWGSSTHFKILLFSPMSDLYLIPLPPPFLRTIHHRHFSPVNLWHVSPHLGVCFLENPNWCSIKKIAHSYTESWWQSCNSVSILLIFINYHKYKIMFIWWWEWPKLSFHIFLMESFWCSWNNWFWGNHLPFCICFKKT